MNDIDLNENKYILGLQPKNNVMMRSLHRHNLPANFISLVSKDDRRMF